MGGFLVSVPVVALVLFVWISLQKTRRSVRSYHQRCSAELSQLISLLSHRHVILSHLLDAIPNKFDKFFDRERMVENRRDSIRRIDEIDPVLPTIAALRGLGDNERQLFDMVDELVEQIEASGEFKSNEAISACLAGLEDSKPKIFNSLSIYNSAAITYNTYVKSRWPSMVAKNAVNEAEFGQFVWGSNHSETLPPE